MKAFISYSLLDSEEYIITLLAEELEEQGFYPDTGPYKLTSTVDDETIFKIKSSHLFIGILMHPSSKSSTLNGLNQRVINEWEYANSRKIPAILLVEKSVQLNMLIKNSVNVLSFDKHHPDEAIAFVKKVREEAQRPLKKDMNNAVAWILGGLALITLITSLANSTQKKKAIAA